MERSIKLRWANLAVGLLLMFALAVLLYGSITGGGISVFDRKITFVCYFRNVEGLVTGSPIWMSGLEVGNVATLGFDIKDSVRVVKVVCRVQRSLRPYLNQDARVQLGTIGFLGDKYVEIIPGMTGAPPIESGSIIQVEDVGSAPAVFAAAERAVSDAGSVASSLDTLLARMNRGVGTLGQLASNEELYTQLTSLAGNLTKLVADLQNNQDRLVGSIEKLSSSVGDLARQASQSEGTVGKLMNDPALYNSLAATAARLDTILAKIDTSAGSAGLLVNDTTLYVQLTNLLTRANNLVTDIEKNPRKYFKFSAF